MINRLVFILYIPFFITACTPKAENNTRTTELMKKATYAIAIHGGAGTILKKNMTAEQEAAYLKALNEALSIGEQILKDGGTSTDAVVEAIMHLENSPLFNAGKGAVFTNAGINELDASIMEGKDLNAGAVGGVTIVKNPILAAKAVMEKSEHVMMVGAGANQFAIEQGLDTVSNSYFYTESRWNSLQRVKANQDKSTGMLELVDYKFGTVGCVALDQQGNLAAGTSTGGMTNKKYNRLGDSPIIGSGNYANNKTCAVSATGHGEYFIRYTVAYDISALMEYKGLSLEAAANEVVNKKLVQAGGEGGVIAVDKYGNVAMPFNSEGMYRGFATPTAREVKIYK
jgi:beta-aspartyl-peptidase (threonine type)